MHERDLEKKSKLMGALEKGMVMIHLDARRAGVSVPDNLRDEKHLRLNLSYRFDPPDLSVTDWGVRSTLTFPEGRFLVAIPWPALFAVTSHVTKDFWFFPEDMPAELFQQSADTPPRAAEPAPRLKPALRQVARVEAEDETAEAATPTASELPPRPSGRSHLRLVK